MPCASAAECNCEQDSLTELPGIDLQLHPYIIPETVSEFFERIQNPSIKTSDSVLVNDFLIIIKNQIVVGDGLFFLGSEFLEKFS